jgi:hypothetical protein
LHKHLIITHTARVTYFHMFVESRQNFLAQNGKTFWQRAIFRA